MCAHGKHYISSCTHIPLLTARPVISQRIQVWDILEGFWSEERIQRWREKIFPDQNRPDQGSETCQNLICLSYDAHAYWGESIFRSQANPTLGRRENFGCGISLATTTRLFGWGRCYNLSHITKGFRYLSWY